VIEIASDNVAINPNPRLFATTLLILVLILILPLREGRKGVAPSPSSLHDRRSGRTIRKSDSFIRRNRQRMKNRLTVKNKDGLVSLRPSNEMISPANECAYPGAGFA
jgi:hypothetical protein